MTPVSAKRKYMCNLLYECIEKEDLEYSKELLQRGADPNLVLDCGAAPFHIAAGLENEDVSLEFSRMILQYGGDPNTRSSEGSTPLHTAAAYGRCETLKLLLEHGGDPELLDQDYMTVHDNARASACELCQIYLKLHGTKSKQLYHEISAEAESKTPSIDDHDDAEDLGNCSLQSSLQTSGSSGVSFHTCNDSLMTERGEEKRASVDVPSSPLTYDPESPLTNPTDSSLFTDPDSSVQCSSDPEAPSGGGDNCKLLKFDETRHSSYTSGAPRFRNSNLSNNNRRSTSEMTDPFAFDSKQLPCDILDTSSLQSASVNHATQDCPSKTTLLQSFGDLSLLTEDRSVIGQNYTLSGGPRFAERKPEESALKQEVPDSDFCSGPLTSSRTSSVSFCECSTRLETFIHTDAKEGFSIIENHYVPLDIEDSCVCDISASSQTTVLYDWKDSLLTNLSVSSVAEDQKIPDEIRKLSNTEVYKKLRDCGVCPGPVTPATRNIYLSQLTKLTRNPSLAKNPASPAEFPSEIQQVLSGKLDLSAMEDLESQMCQPFIMPDPRVHWREGTKKNSFTYLLLDPRVTQNLPVRAKTMDEISGLMCFLQATFYVGKGKRSRPYGHFKEAIKHVAKPTGKPPSAKVSQILDIWDGDQGVVSLHIFQNVIPCEAFTREACMIEAFGLSRLTNKMPGSPYGPAARWAVSRRRTLGILLLRKAFRILLSEGERQIHPHDVKS